MDLPRGGSQIESDKGNPWKVSLDRIDSDVGYLKGNVRFIILIANLCKQSWTDEGVIRFCNMVSEHHKLGD
jgi:hypothetical protein